MKQESPATYRWDLIHDAVITDDEPEPEEPRDEDDDEPDVTGSDCA